MADGEESYADILTAEQREIVTKAVALKNEKMDILIDKSISEHKLNAYNTLILYLKVDIKVCEALLRMDLNSKESVQKEFSNIMEALDNTVEPKNMHYYVDLLTPEEMQLEANLANIFMHIQRLMIGKYHDLVKL